MTDVQPSYGPPTNRAFLARSALLVLLAAFLLEHQSRWPAWGHRPGAFEKREGKQNHVPEELVLQTYTGHWKNGNERVNSFRRSDS